MAVSGGEVQFYVLPLCDPVGAGDDSGADSACAGDREAAGGLFAVLVVACHVVGEYLQIAAVLGRSWRRPELHGFLYVGPGAVGGGV